MASKTPVSGVHSNGFPHQAPKVIASHEMSIEFVINYYSCFKTDLRSSGNIQAVLKTSVKREIIWKHCNSFEIVPVMTDLATLLEETSCQPSLKLPKNMSLYGTNEIS